MFLNSDNKPDGII